MAGAARMEETQQTQDTASVAALKERLLGLNKIGIALSSEGNLEKLLDLILTEARHFTHAEAGSLYIVDNKDLLFMVAQNDEMARRNPQAGSGSGFKGIRIPVSKSWLAGYVAETGEILNFQDVYKIPGAAPFKFNKDFDKKSNYRTQSMLLVPMRDSKGFIIGVLQLINAKHVDGNVTPFDATDEELLLSMSSQAAVAIKNAKLTDDLKKAYVDTILRLSAAAEYRDQEDTAMHIRRMSAYSKFIAEEMKLPPEEIEAIFIASPMHDIGKIGIPDHILLKPAKLSPEEYEEMKKHVLIGSKILEGADHDLLKLSEVIARTHHEKYDGTGYPYLLKGEEIPLSGRIAALADVFDALSSKRVYKPAMPLEKVMDIVMKEKGKHFDPLVVEAFIPTIDKCIEIRDKYSPEEHEEQKKEEKHG